MDRTPATCDQYSLVHHRHRARVLLKDAYDSAKPDRSQIEAAQEHSRCILVAKVRRQIHNLRVRLKERAEQDPSNWCSPDPAPDGGGCWEIPVACVMAESGGSWTAENPSSPARGPYQLLGHGEPWPVTTYKQAMAHHRIAEDLRASQGMEPWVAPAC